MEEHYKRLAGLTDTLEVKDLYLKCAEHVRGKTKQSVSTTKLDFLTDELEQRTTEFEAGIISESVFDAIILDQATELYDYVKRAYI